MKIFDLRDLDELRVSNDRWLTLYIVICFAFHLIIFKLPIPYPSPPSTIICRHAVVILPYTLSIFLMYY